MGMSLSFEISNVP